MEIITGKQLLLEPEGVVFMEYEPHVMKSSLMMFEGAIEDIDFFYRIIIPDATVNDQMKSEITFPSDVMRDGLFDLDTRQFLVLDDDDRALLAHVVMGNLHDSRSIEVP